MAQTLFSDFQKRYDQGLSQLVWHDVVADLETPVSAFLKIAHNDDNSFLLESVEGGSLLGRYSSIGIAPDITWRCIDGQANINRNAVHDTSHFEACQDSPLESLRQLARECRIDYIPADMPPMAASGLFGYLGYDMVREIEAVEDNNPDDLGIPDSIMIRPTIMVVFDNIKHMIKIVTPVYANSSVTAEESYQNAQGRIEAIRLRLKQNAHKFDRTGAEAKTVSSLDIQSNTPKQDYLSMVEQAKDHILAGDIFQTVLSQRFQFDFPKSGFDLYRTLRRLNPSPFLFYLNIGGFEIAGSSPEILVRVRENKVTVRPIAGTRPRGQNAEEDKALAQDLLDDPKECAEHLMLLDLGRNDIGRVAEIGSVTVTDQFTIEHYSHVMHIVSNVEGTLRDDIDGLDALFAGFPAGTVSGAPKIMAMNIIDRLEKSKRKLYAGCIGYLDGNGNIDTCIALRTALIKDGKVYIQAGAGIVADSDPESEYEECCNKAQALVKAAEMALAQSGALS